MLITSCRTTGLVATGSLDKTINIYDLSIDNTPIAQLVCNCI